MLVFDLDHFKLINDRFGHAGGDSVLRGFGDMLGQHFGEDAMIARIGGEEFCVVVATNMTANRRANWRKTFVLGLPV